MLSSSVHIPCTSLQVASSPAEVVSACDITLAMLSDPEACLAVAKGALSSLQRRRGDTALPRRPG